MRFAEKRALLLLNINSTKLVFSLHVKIIFKQKFDMRIFDLKFESSLKFCQLIEPDKFTLMKIVRLHKMTFISSNKG
jgi:hypothetical protein